MDAAAAPGPSGGDRGDGLTADPFRDRIIAKRLYLGIAWEVFPQALRTAGSSAQEVMELLRDGDQVDVIVCRNAALLEEVLGRWHGGRLGP